MKGFAFRFLLMFSAVFVALFFLVWFYLSAVTPAAAGEPPSVAATPAAPVFATGWVRIHTAGAVHTFKSELALTGDQQARGLMFRDIVPAGTAMLFDFLPPRPITMWMKNTPASLDMLFTDDGGKIIYIAEQTQPFSLDRIAPPRGAAPVRYVLEVAAGTARRLAIAVGDTLAVATP